MTRSVSRPALVLNGAAFSEQTDFGTALLGADVDVVFRDIDEIAIDIGPGCVRIWETVDGRDLRDFGLVQVLAYHRPTASLLNAVADYAAANGVRAVNIAGIGAPTKLFKYVRLASRGLSVPLTIYRPARLLTDGYEDMASHLDLPFVLKTVTGGSGRLTSLVGNERAFGRRLGDVEHARVGFLAQEFVPPDGSYLLLVLGGEVSLAMRYQGVDDMLIRPVWDDASLIEVHDLDHEARQTAVRAAASLDYDVAGVHLVRHWTTGQWCLLDVNPNPLTSGDRYAADRIDAYAAYLKRRLAQPVPSDRYESSDAGVGHRQ